MNQKKKRNTNRPSNVDGTHSLLQQLQSRRKYKTSWSRWEHELIESKNTHKQRMNRTMQSGTIHISTLSTKITDNTRWSVMNSIMQWSKQKASNKQRWTRNDRIKHRYRAKRSEALPTTTVERRGIDWIREQHKCEFNHALRETQDSRQQAKWTRTDRITVETNHASLRVWGWIRRRSCETKLRSECKGWITSRHTASAEYKTTKWQKRRITFDRIISCQRTQNHTQHIQGKQSTTCSNIRQPHMCFVSLRKIHQNKSASPLDHQKLLQTPIQHRRNPAQLKTAAPNRSTKKFDWMRKHDTERNRPI